MPRVADFTKFPHYTSPNGSNLCWSPVNVREDRHHGTLGSGQPAGAGCPAQGRGPWPGGPGSAASPRATGSSLNHNTVEEQIAC